MAKKSKSNESKDSTPEVKPADAGETAPKPTLFKRIVKTIESLSKDKKVKFGSGSIKSASEGAEISQGSGLEMVSTPDASAPMNVDKMTEKSKKRPKAEKAKAGEPGVTEPTAAQPPPGGPITVPPVASVYTLAASDTVSEAAKAAKFALEPPHPATGRRPLVPIDLVEQIYATRLVLLVRDPEMLYAYWDISDEDRKFHRIDALVPPRQLALRLYDHGRELHPSGHAHVYVDFLLQPGVDSRYLKLPLKDRWWKADLGVKDEMVGFTVLARSNTVRSPRDQVAEWGAGVRPLMVQHAAHAGQEQMAQSTTAGEVSAHVVPTREGIFAGTFRLSGGSAQSITGSKQEIIETNTETRSVMKVRTVGSSAMTTEEELETYRTLKVRSVGASDLSSRQG